jgi:hypothetical protein
VGLGDLFRRRRERESAIPPSATESQALGSFASGERQPVVGQQIGGGAPGMPANLTDLPGMLESMQSLDAPQTIDMRGSGLREEILGIMQQHGLDPESMSGQQVDASAMPAMQQQILEALGKYGIDPNASGSSIQFGIEDSDQPK